jgi:pyruvate,orthophosphate dikinase
MELPAGAQALVHPFPPLPGQGSTGGRADSTLLGGKGAGLVLMTSLGLPVPPGFVVTTAAGREHHTRDGLSPVLRAGIRAETERLAGRLGRRFGGPADRLVVAVRSGAPESMPGMLDTLLDVGGEGEGAYSRLFGAVEAVLRSWDSDRARTYRRLRGLGGGTGTAVVVQAMVDGTADGFSGTGVLFTRDPSTGAPGPTGEFLLRARGPALVDGVRTPEPLATLAESRPERYAELVAHAGTLERVYADMCEVEFTIERDRLWLLQVRPGKRTGRAGVRIAVDLARAGLIDRAEAARRGLRYAGSGPPTALAGVPDDRLLCRGLAGSPGSAVGRIALDLAAVEEFADRGEPVILVRRTTEPADLPAMALSAGVLTAAGGTTSHAAVVARELGIPCVCGASGLEIELDRRVVRVAGRELSEGTVISIDGARAVAAEGRHAVGPDAGAGDDLELRRLLADWAAGAADLDGARRPS